MYFHNLRDFMAELESRGELKRIRVEVDPKLQISEIADRVIRKKGPALFFERVKGSHIPLAINLFGTKRRMALALGVDNLEEIEKRIRDILDAGMPQGRGSSNHKGTFGAVESSAGPSPSCPN